MLTLESKTGIARGSQEKVFGYITDFRNFARMIPEERLTELEIEKENISFNLAGLGKISLYMHEKTPCSKVLIKSAEGPAGFTFAIYLGKAGDSTEVRMQLEANLNMFLEMMAKGPLQQLLDLMVDKLAAVDFTDPNL